MFDRDKKKPEPVKKKRYTDFLASAMGDVGNEMRRFSRDKELLGVFRDINQGKYDVLSSLHSKDTKHALALIDLLASYGVDKKIEFAMQRIFARYFDTTEEIDAFLSGLSRSLTSDKTKIDETVTLFKTHPILIFCRLVELAEAR